MDLLKEEQYFKSRKKDEGMPRIFISHSGRDEKIATAFVELLEGLGLNQKHIFCSSVPGYNIPLGKDIYDHLQEEFQNSRIYVIFLLSKNYYESAACLNEMGAAWVLRSEYLSVILPGFSFSEIKGAVNPNRIAIDLNKDCRDRLNDLKEQIEVLFGTEKISMNRWERYRESFTKRIITC